MVGKILRMRRIFKGDGRSLIVAVDHGIALGPIRGIEDPRGAIRKIVEGEPDAIMVTLGILMSVADLLPPNLGVILSIGTAGEGINVDYAVEQAISLGVDAIKIFLPVNTDNEKVALSETFALCQRASLQGLPVMVEVYPLKDKYSPEVVSKYTRIAAEMGASIVKTFYTGSPETFSNVTSSSLVPVVILGGPKAEDTLGLFRMVSDSLKAGGSGIAFGRNIWQSDDPQRMIRNLKLIIHEGKSPEEVVGIE